MKSVLAVLSRHIRSSYRKHARKSSAWSNARRQRKRTQLNLELLEDRMVPTTVALPSGIVSWWTANNTAADAMGLNNATLTNVTYATGEVGQAFSFNGSTSRAEVADSSSLAFTASFTIEAWIKVSALPSTGNHAEIMFRGADGSPSPYSLSVEPNGNALFSVFDGQTNGSGSGLETPISTGQWTHIAATLDNATGLMSLYVNGVMTAQTTTDVRPFATLPSSGSPGVGIGNANGTSTNDPFNGQIDELAVYNRALTPGEVLGIYKAGSSGKVSSPIAISNPSVIEGAAGTTQSESFTITRTGSTTGSLAVNWTTADDTAKAGMDYVGASGTVTFAGGQATASVNVTVNGSNTDGPNKDFELIVTPSGGTSVLGVGTIQNANAAVSISDASATEGDTTIRYFDDFIPGQARLGGGRWFAFAPSSEGGNLYIAIRFTDQVLEYDGKTGAYIGVVVPAGANPSGTNPLHAPWALTFGPDGNLYVAGVLSNNVLRYNMTTGAIDEFVPSSAGVYQPMGLEFDSNGDLLVTNSDTGNSDTSPLRDEVLRFDPTGAALPASGQSGAVFVPSGSGGLSTAHGLAFGPDDNLYVASAATNTVDEYNGTTGASLRTFVSAGSGGLSSPQFIGFRPDGYLYVSGGDGAIYRYNATTGAFSNKVYQDPNHYGAGAMAWDANGNLLAGFGAATNMQGRHARLGVASQEAFTVSLDYPSALPITVSYSTADGSATAGTDYRATFGTVVFAPGETSKTILIQTLDDGGADPNQSFTVSLSSPVNATLVRSQGTGTIVDPATILVVGGFASPTTAGVSHNFTVTAEDGSGNTVTGYAGTVTFTSSDGLAGLPANYTFVSGDAGVHTFSATLKTAGSQSITATDTVTSAIMGSQTGITVNPAAASTLVVGGFASPTTAGVSHNFTITARDALGNTATGYTGTVTFTSSDGLAGLPANYTFVSGDAGVHTFSATLKTAGTQSITATDTATNTIMGSQSAITVNPAAASHFSLLTPATATANVAFGITVTALDLYQNIATGYTGTAQISSTDPGPGVFLPANYTFTSGDAGIHTFSNGVTLQTAGNQTISVQDSMTSSILGSALVSVLNPLPTISSLSKTTATEGSAALMVTITGSGFVYTSSAQWNGTPVTTMFISGNSLQANIPASDLAEEGSASITVANSTPGGGTSNGETFTISDAPLTPTTQSITAGEGKLFSGTVADFTDTNGMAPITDFTGSGAVKINWGDGTSPTSGTVTQPGGIGTPFVIGGSHIYSEEGKYSLIVTVTDAGGSTTSASTDVQVFKRDDIIGRFSQTGQWWVGASNGSTGFASSLWATWNPAVTWVDVQTVDLNGDGRADIVGRDQASGNWWVGISNGSSFATSLWGNWSPAATWVDVQVGDFNGDGKIDIIGRYAQTGQWWMAQSTGSSFVNSLWTTWNPNVTWVDVKVGDFNGDGKADITGRYLQGGSWWTGISTGSSFQTSQWASWNPNVTWVDVNVGDFNGDGKADIVGRYLQGGQWYVGLSNGTSFDTALWTTWSPNVTWVDVKVGDFNGDGKADIIGRWSQAGQWWVAQSTGSSFTNNLWATWSPAVTWVDVQIGDFNGDGLSDITGRVQQNGQWWAGISTNSSFQTSLWADWNPNVSWVDVHHGDYA